MRNPGVVIEGELFRSGKYTAAALRTFVEEVGIRRVVDLRDGNPLLAESTYRKIGVEFIRFPLCEDEPIPDNALDIWDGRTPTLVHCWKGSHRTGAWCAIMRRHQGWSRDAIEGELQRYGFGDPAKHIELYESIWSYPL